MEGPHEPPKADDELRRNLSDIGCPYVEPAMVPNHSHQVWKDPAVADDDDTYGLPPTLADDSSDDELGADDGQQNRNTVHANEFDA